MTHLSTIELQKERMSFSSGHFTIFSDTDREALHGHNYRVHAAITTEIGEEGLSFDYRYYKKALYKICDDIDQVFLLPQHSPHCEIKEEGEHLYVHFNKEVIPFLRKDVILLPLQNITVEELSKYILDLITEDQATLRAHNIVSFVIKVFSGPGQSASASWQANG